MKATIVIASMTGNDEDLAEILSDDLENEGFEVESNDVSFADATDYLTSDLCIFVTYTYGEGAMTDEVADFYAQLKTLNLKNKYFAVMGSGDKSYRDHYCETVDDFENVFKACGAKSIMKPLKIENSVDEADIAQIDACAKEIKQAINA